MPQSTTLPNGIKLPTPWPPVGINMAGTNPQPVPYLDAPPEVIDIRLGRQLFVDSFLTEPTTSDMTRLFHKPAKYPGNPVFTPTSKEERHEDFAPCAIAKSGGVWFDDADDKFKMWYMTGYVGWAALAVSDDGVHWDRPIFDVVPQTNLILPKNLHPDSGSVIIDHWASDPSTRYKMLMREPNPPGKGCIPGLLFTSPDGVHWQQVGKTGDMHDRSTMFYDPFTQKWVQSIRMWHDKAFRCRYFNQHDDFIQSGQWEVDKLNPWLRADHFDSGRYCPPQIYNFDAIAYESLMIGFHQMLDGPGNNICEAARMPKLTELYLSSSRDGYHWHRPDRTAFIGAQREYGSWEYGYVEPSAGMCLIVGDEVWIYYSAMAGAPERTEGTGFTSGTYSNGGVGLAKIRRDGFASMRAAFNGAQIQTRKLRFAGSTLYVNASTVGTTLTVAVLGEDGKALPGLGHEDCVGFLGNSTKVALRWKNKDLSGLGDQKVRLQFRMNRGDIFAFWITDDPQGKSGGYVGGGGPGFKAGVDQ